MTSSRKLLRKIGLPPGTLVHTGERKTDKVTLHLIQYNESALRENPLDPAGILPAPNADEVTWIDVDGLHNTELIERIGAHCDMHPLLLEDILNTHQRPKVDAYDRHLYIVCRMLRYDENEHAIRDEQYSIVLGDNYIVTFQEGPGDVLDTVRERIRAGKGKIRRRGADYLAYALLDAIVDNYFIVLEKMGDEIEKIERDLLGDPKPRTLRSLHYLKREMIGLRKSVWPLRDVAARMSREEEDGLITTKTQLFCRDLFDHVVRIMDTIESQRDLLSGMIDVYMSSVSHKMNGIMQVLTVISTIFMPLTLITGIYGMNFDHMPELHWRLGYPFSLGLMFAVSAGALFYVRQRRWMG